MIERQAIRVDCPAATPEEAIREAGNALCRAGACSPQYVQAMVDSYRELGPYFVIAPGLALPHARPEQGSGCVNRWRLVMRKTTRCRWCWGFRQPAAMRISTLSSIS